MSEKAISKKREVIDEIIGKIKDAKSVTLVEFNGMDVKEITDLRTDFRKANTEYKVYKNTMMRFAFKELGFDEISNDLVGSNALLFSNEEIVDGPKIASKYIDENEANKEKLIIKSGVVEGNYQNAEQMVAISKLPSTQELASMLVNTLQAPIRKLAGDLNQINAKLVYALDAVREKKENEAA